MSNSTITPSTDKLLLFFDYQPSTEFALICSGLYAAYTLIMAVHTYRYGGQFMLIVVAMGVIEVIGYGLRYQLIESGDDAANAVFALSTLCLLLSPIALALVDYIVIGRVLHQIGKPVQATGGAMAASGNMDTINLGKSVVLVGLVVQLCFFTAFSYITVVVSTHEEYYHTLQLPALRPVFLCVEITIALMYIRNIYRVVDFAVDRFSYIATHEWFFIAFEFVPIFLCFLCFLILHFGRTMQLASPNPDWIKQIDARKTRLPQEGP